MKQAKQLIDYFLPKNKLGHFETQKARFLAAIMIFGVVLSTFVLLQTFFSSNKNFVVAVMSQLVGIFIFGGTLFLIKYRGYKTGGNFVTLSLILLMSLSVNMVTPETINYKYVQGFYTVLALLIFNALFTSRRVLFVSYLIVILGSVKLFVYGLNNAPEQADFITSAFTQHTIIATGITILIFFTRKFNEQAVSNAEEETRKSVEKNNELQKMFELITETSNKLQTLSTNITNSVVELSNNANEQASSLEELAATMEELTQSVSSNSDYTENTVSTVKNTRELSAKNAKTISGTLNSVNEVNEKIKLIRDIANKTGLLSINAAIEAARAGESGKGFTVVAQEVKKLAEKSELGSKEIRTLISNTIKLSDAAGKNYQIISGDIVKVLDAIQNISTSTEEQKISVEQINSALQQISNGSQNNATLANNLNDALHEINDNIKKLEEYLA